MNTKTTAAADEAEIREMVASWLQAVRAKDVNAIMSHYMADVLTFDIVPPLKYEGTNAYRKNWEAWFPTFFGPVGYEIRDLGITASDDIAFSHSLNHISGTRSNGEETDVWIRVTVCYRKIGGRWMIAHEHISVPFYMDGSDRAAVDLKP
jgi:uncharacterized protein (TIGR02246 family)